MAQFSKYNQPKRRGGGHPLDRNSKAGQKRAALARKEYERELEAYVAFANAESGNFNGFAFANIFHSQYSKANALEVLLADDCAEVVTSKGAIIRSGADGICVYVMTEEARVGNVKKRVCFNRSIYVF